jgi:hypothetical protein
VLSLAAILFYLLLFRRWTNGWTATACFVLPFGIYTTITYATTSATFIHAVLVSALFVAAGYSALLLTRKVKNKQKKHLSEFIKIVFSDVFILFPVF